MLSLWLCVLAQHFFIARLDMAVDGLNNKVVEVSAETSPQDPTKNRCALFKRAAALVYA